MARYWNEIVIAANVAKAASVEHFPAGDTILRQEGEPARDLYVAHRLRLHRVDRRQGPHYRHQDHEA